MVAAVVEAAQRLQGGVALPQPERVVAARPLAEMKLRMLESALCHRLRVDPREDEALKLSVPAQPHSSLRNRFSILVRLYLHRTGTSF